MESTDSSVATAAGRAHNPQPEHSYSDYPAGFRFHPTDEELVVHYLKRKAQSLPLPASIIAEVDLYKFDPWELPAKAIFGEQEWYFFSPRDRKYPNGARPNRAATSGYWKATGTDKPVVSAGSKGKVGVKKALVFYGGKPPRGIKTNWIMHEYRLADNKASNKPPGYDHSHNKKGSLRLDDWVLCRIYKKNNNQRPMDQERENSMEEQHMMMMGSLSNNLGSLQNPMMHTSIGHHLTKTPLNYTTLLETHEQQQQQTTYFDHGLMDPSTSTMSLKRNLPSFWTTNDHDSSNVSPSKRVSLLSNDNNNDNNDNSNMGQGSLRGNNDEENLSNNNNTNSNAIANLLNQQSMLGNISDGGFRHPYSISGMNWYP